MKNLKKLIVKKEIITRLGNNEMENLKGRGGTTIEWYTTTQLCPETTGCTNFSGKDECYTADWDCLFNSLGPDYGNSPTNECPEGTITVGCPIYVDTVFVSWG